MEPTLRQLTICYLIFGTWARPLWNGVLRDLVDELRQRLVTLPAEQRSWPQKAARRATLDAMGAVRTEVLEPGTHANGVLRSGRIGRGMVC